MIMNFKVSADQIFDFADFAALCSNGIIEHAQEKLRELHIEAVKKLMTSVKQRGDYILI